MTSKPWFGPRARAKQILARTSTIPLDPLAFFAEVQRLLGDDASGIQHVRFIDYVNRKDTFHYRIALCWTIGNVQLRDALYRSAAAIAEATGWYVLPQGSRLGSVAKERFRKVGAQIHIIPKCFDAITSIESAVKSEDGCSIRVRFKNGNSLLLDTGLPDRLVTDPSDRLVLISHAHADHVGGLTTQRCVGIPIAMSPVTAELLLNNGYLDIHEFESQCLLVSPGVQHEIGPGVHIEAFAVPHLPGSVGWIVADDHNAVVFTGDISLTTARHSFETQLESVCLALNPRKVTLLLDATMAGRSAGASTATPARSLIDQDAEQIVVVADSGEHLLYSYLDIFHEIQSSQDRHSTSFVVSRSTRYLFELIHSAFIRRRTLELDPFILGQYGATMSAWGESRWLYWSDDMTETPTNRTIWFMTRQDLRTIAGPREASIVTIGRDDIKDDFTHRHSWTVLAGIDTTPWTLHSSEVAVAEMCTRLQDIGIQVVLFHNYSGRMRKFIRDRRLNVMPLSGTFLLEGTI